MKKIQLIIIAFFICITNSCSQSIDSVSVKGNITWDKENISDFPTSIKITNNNDSSIAKEIKLDSLGRFYTRLAPGKYKVIPSKYYHWQGEDIVRIDMKKSLRTIVISKEKPSINLSVKIRTLQKPQLIPEKGILHNFNPSSTDDINSFMKAYMEYYKVVGATLAILKKGKVVFHNNYGVKSAISKEEVDSATLFEAGSITKTVLSFITMRLYEKNRIDLDKPLYRYLVFEDIQHDIRYKKITARMVLSHQTGFPSWASGKFDLKFEPGTKFGYSGEAFEYLKRVLEKISNKSISILIKEEFLDPLNLKDIYFKGEDFSMDLLSNGHKRDRISKKRNIKSPMMAYSMITNARAFAKFAIALRNREGLKQETYQELFSIQSTREDGTHWGLGFRIEDSKFGKTYGHSGSTNPGFIGNYVYYDNLDMGYVVLTNSQMGGWLSLPLLTKFLITGDHE